MGMTIDKSRTKRAVIISRGDKIMPGLRSALILTALMAVATIAKAETLSPEQAGGHVGENATVCGTVALCDIRHAVSGPAYVPKCWRAVTTTGLHNSNFG